MPDMAARAREGRAGIGRAGRPAAELDRSTVARAVGGEPDAQREVFERQRAMIARLARERADRGLSHDDLLQEGSLGLLAAMHEYAGGVQAPFEAYAETRVGEQMDRALEDEQAAVREEQQRAEDANAFEQAELALRRELQRDATPEELRERLGWTPERLDDVAAAVTDARQQHDEELLPYLDPDYFDPLDWIGEDESGTPAGGDGGA
jgi:RNA polymerase primary sigma factor